MRIAYLRITTVHLQVLLLAIFVFRAAQAAPDPFNLQVTKAGPAIGITWQAIGGATSYIIKRDESSAPGNYTTIATLNPGVTSYYDPSATAGIAYDYRVDATISGGATVSSVPVPAQLTSSMGGAALKSVSLTSDSPVGAVSGYAVIDLILHERADKQTVDYEWIAQPSSAPDPDAFPTPVPAPHLRYGKNTILEVWYPSTLQVNVSGEDENYATSQTANIFASGQSASTTVEQKTITYINSKADSYAINISYSDVSYIAASANGVLPSDAPVLPPVFVPVDYGLFQGSRVSYSAGLLYSTLRDSQAVLQPTSTMGSDSIANGLSSDASVKETLITHYSIWKQGDLLIGPFAGVASNIGSTGTSTSAIFGVSIIKGTDSRFALNFGWEAGNVNRMLPGYAVGQTVPAATTITQSVPRISSLEFGLSFAFGSGSTSSGNGSQNASSQQQATQNAANPGGNSPKGGH
jgi:hypothetical protein